LVCFVELLVLQLAFCFKPQLETTHHADKITTHLLTNNKQQPKQTSDCPELMGFDLCAACHARPPSRVGRFNQQHTSAHRLERVQPSGGGAVLNALQLANPGLPARELLRLLALQSAGDEEGGEEGGGEEEDGGEGEEAQGGQQQQEQQQQ
jgi:hypothetical protein